MRFLFIGCYNTSIQKIQYPHPTFIYNILDYGKTNVSFHFIDPIYKNNIDNILEYTLHTNNISNKYPISIQEFLVSYPLKPNDIIIDFSGSYDFNSIIKKLGITRNDVILDSLILIPLQCGCNENLYTLNDNQHIYIDYQTILYKYIKFGKTDIELKKQIHPPSLSDSLLERSIERSNENVLDTYIKTYFTQLNTYLRNTNKSTFNYEIENKNYLYSEFSKLIANIRWYLIGHTEPKVYHYIFIDKDNYTNWLERMKRIAITYLDYNTLKLMELYQIIQLYSSTNLKFNFKLIFNDLENFYKSEDKTKYLSTLDYNNILQYELFILDYIIDLFKKKIDI